MSFGSLGFGGRGRLIMQNDRTVRFREAIFPIGQRLIGGMWCPWLGSTLYTTEALTTNVAALGNAVGGILDVSGNAYHAVEATSGDRPVYGCNPLGGQRNLLNFSQQFDNAYWVKGNVSVVPNAVTAPDGTLTADKVVENGTSAYHSVVSPSATNYTDFVSIYVKPAGRDFANIYSTNNNRCVIVNLLDGSYVYAGNSPSGVTTENVGGGWWRIIIQGIAAAVNQAVRIGPYPQATALSGYPYEYQGDGSSGIYVWGAQNELGAATAYQNVVIASSTNVTSPGERSAYYLGNISSDTIEATLPAMSNAVVIYASDNGIEELTEQVISAGAFDILRDQRLYGIVVRDGAMSEDEKNKIKKELSYWSGYFF